MREQVSALVMAGGRGERLDTDEEKPLVRLAGSPMIKHVLDALEGSWYVNRIIGVTSPFTPKTEKYLLSRGYEAVKAPGEGFVEDLQWCLKEMGLKKTLAVSSDLPLLTGEDIEMVVGEYYERGLPHLSVQVPEEVMKVFGIRPTMVRDGMVPSGINIVDGDSLSEEGEALLVTSLLPFVFNVNTLEELHRAESILTSRENR
jgi:adenosylcobinamide-phosphate guanylyltransferase